jgi:hypothetical protein
MLVAIGGHMGLSIPKPFYADLYGAGQRQVEDLKSHNMQQTDPACHVAAGESTRREFCDDGIVLSVSPQRVVPTRSGRVSTLWMAGLRIRETERKLWL